MSARVEVERLTPVRQDFLGQSAGHHLGQGLLLRLSLTGKLGAAVTEPGDVVLVEVKVRVEAYDRDSTMVKNTFQP